VLATVSPFFKDLLSLPQPSDSEMVDGLPVVQLPENSELVNSLISILYPICTVIPKSYEKVLYLLATCQDSVVITNVYHKVLYLLAACQKYDMTSVQSSIRAKVKHGDFPAPKGAEAFPAYAIAGSKGLIPEMENAARKTLDLPMTFEVLGEGLRLFDGRALCDLANFRKRCRDNFTLCLDPFLEVQPTGPSSIWVGCPEVMPPLNPKLWNMQINVLPTWLSRLFSLNQKNLKFKSSRIHSIYIQEYVRST
jgi:hypothetical protein